MYYNFPYGRQINHICSIIFVLKVVTDMVVEEEIGEMTVVGTDVITEVTDVEAIGRFVSYHFISLLFECLTTNGTVILR